MTQRDANARWATRFATGLAQSGLEHVTLAPGSRSTPLVLALAQQDPVTMHVHVDERSAAFHALGIGKATGTPAAVLTTSGTATANLHPATIEARYSSTPLVLLTADRPPEQHGTDANQTIDQTNLYGDHVIAHHDLGPPTNDPQALHHVQKQAHRILAHATHHPGPIHVNCPFPKPLEPPQKAPPAPTRPTPETRIHHPPRLADDATLERLAEAIDRAQRPLLVAGPAPPTTNLGPAALALADATQAPLLADPLSGARFTPDAPQHALAAYDHYLRHETTQDQLEPDLVLQLGATPTSKPLATWLGTLQTPHTTVDDTYPPKDAHDAATTYLKADPADAATRLAPLVKTPAPKRWRHAWHEAEDRTRRILDDEITTSPFEATVLHHAATRLPPDGTLVVGNSMPVRDLDAYAPPREAPLTVFANRGASGIDGLVSTTIGAWHATQQPTLAVLGDLTFLHDANGLHGLPDPHHPLVFLVINNDGGGIFHQLPIRNNPAFETYFATPHGRTLEPLADLHEIHHARIPIKRLDKTLEDALHEPTITLLEVTSDREENQRRHDAVHQRIDQTLRRNR